MFIDTSAIIAIIKDEHEAEYFSSLLASANNVYTSPIVLLEATMRLSSIFRIEPDIVTTLLDEFVSRTRIEIVSVDREMGRLAANAFAHYGKGRHPAGLNFGDCLSYAAAKALKAPLLFKGNDFALTDIERVR